VRHRSQERRLELVRATRHGRCARGLGPAPGAVGELRGHQCGEQQQHQAQGLVGARHREGAARIDEQQVVAEDGGHDGRDGRSAAPAAGSQHDRHQVQQDGRREVDHCRLEQADGQKGGAYRRARQQVLDQHVPPHAPPPPHTLHIVSPERILNACGPHLNRI
jgi:hypothetical protein